MALFSLLAVSCSDAGRESLLQQHADALAQGDGRGACGALAAPEEGLETKCTEHLAWIRANAPWLPGAKVRVESSKLDEGDTRVLATVSAVSKLGDGKLVFKLACDPGRKQYPMASCRAATAPGAFWIFSVEKAPP